MTVIEFIHALGSRGLATHKTGSGWMACCPAHEDSTASLSISEGRDGRVLLRCHAGCGAEAIVSALGLKLAHLFPPRTARQTASRPRIVATYDYRDEHGKMLFQCVRYDPKDFRQRRPDPAKPGHWLWNLKDTRRVLFRLSELNAALTAGRTIFVVEGERDVDILVKHGFAATCNPMGAGKWLPEHTETLRRAARVVVIADKDEPGRKHAQAVASALHGVAKSAKLIELPDRDEKPVKDASDWFGAGGTAEELRAIVNAAPEFAPPSASPPVGQNGQVSASPARWFADRFPALSDEFGDAILEETDKDGKVSARDIGEDFFAATLGDKGRPVAPTVFLPSEEKFFSYDPREGVFVYQREPVLLAGLSRLLLDCARACREGCETRTLEFRFRDAANLSGVLRKARGLLEKPHDFFSTDLTEFIPCANGMLRLKDKALLPFSPEYRRRNKLAVPFDSTARCPLFLETLMRPALESDELDLMQRWCGLALIGENLAQKLVILTGTAGGGKGTFVRVLNGIIGQTNLASLRTHLLGERFELSRFLGKTLLYGADVPENFLNQRGASVLKSLTGYDPVTLEFKNSNESPSILCRFNVIVTSNSRLTVHLEGDVEAWRRRLCLVDYHKPKPQTVISDLDQRILASEGPGVLNWMLEGLDKLRSDRWQLRLTDRQQATVDNLLLESDGHAVFVREALVRADRQRLTLPDAFEAYVEFCNRRGWAALTRNKFGQLIGDTVSRAYGLTPRHDVPDASSKAQRGWHGLTLREKFPQPTEKKVSEVSEKPFSDESDTISPVDPAKISTNASAMIL